MTAAIRSSLRQAALLAALALFGCAEPEPERAREPAFDPASLAVRSGCESRSFEGSAFTICRFDAAEHELEFVVHGADGKPLRGFAPLERHLGPRAVEVAFAMNAGMYDEGGEPIGLYVEDGEKVQPLNLREGEGNFHLMPNGVFAVDDQGRVSIANSARFAAQASSSRWATQSGPMLVEGGKLHPKFDANGASQLVRNGVGVAGPRVAWFAISEEGVSFGRFARLFRDALGCKDALYLDGAVSSLWDPGAGRQDAYAELGPMIVAFRKAAKVPG